LLSKASTTTTVTTTTGPPTTTTTTTRVDLHICTGRIPNNNNNHNNYDHTTAPTTTTDSIPTETSASASHSSIISSASSSSSLCCRHQSTHHHPIPTAANRNGSCGVTGTPSNGGHEQQRQQPVVDARVMTTTSKRMRIPEQYHRITVDGLALPFPFSKKVNCTISKKVSRTTNNNERQQQQNHDGCYDDNDDEGWGITNDDEHTFILLFIGDDTSRPFSNIVFRLLSETHSRYRPTSIWTWSPTNQTLCTNVLQPFFAKSDRKFSSNEVLLSGAVATDRSANERAVNRLKASGRIAGGIHQSQDLECASDIWIAWGFQCNFMYKPVL
jgi:hypothetical protein